MVPVVLAVCQPASIFFLLLDAGGAICFMCCRGETENSQRLLQIFSMVPGFSSVS